MWELDADFNVLRSFFLENQFSFDPRWISGLEIDPLTGNFLVVASPFFFGQGLITEIDPTVTTVLSTLPIGLENLALGPTSASIGGPPSQRKLFVSAINPVNRSSIVEFQLVPEPATWLLAAVATAFLAVCMKRSQSMPRTVVAALALLVLGATSSVQAEILDGQAVLTEFSMYYPHGKGDTWSLYRVVGPGTEITVAAGIAIEVDFSDTNILITSLGTISDFGAQNMSVEFWDANGTIPRFTSVTVNPATTWPGFTPGQSTFFGPNFIDVYLNGPPSAVAGQQISLDLTAMIPEPATWMLVAMAISLIPLRRRPPRSAPPLLSFVP
jgi:hypothetical protein